jgi:hypothetical protein
VQPAEAILDAVGHLPAASVQVDEVEREALIRVGARIVARVDLAGRHGVLVVVPRERIPALRKAFPTCRPSAGGVVFDPMDPQGRSEAIAAIRGRAGVARLAWQLAVASP